jgi:adenosylcobinamide-phosphate synthase
MILESILIISFALFLDLIFGDPKNKFHPTAWVGVLIAKLVPIVKNKSPLVEKIGGILVVVSATSFVTIILVFLNIGISYIQLETLTFIAVVVSGAILLKTTIAIRGMEKHALAVMDSIELNDLEEARTRLSMIVKRNTKDLDKNHILSATLESIGENTVDGITGPLFYFAFFGLPGAFIYRIINTIDSMVGYKTNLFKNVGWFGANCDKILNYLPARITSHVMVIGALFFHNDWKKSYQIMKRDGKNTESPNAGYPMAALAGALGTRFEKLGHYSLGEGDLVLTKTHLHSAITLMKVTSFLFCALLTIPIIIALSYVGWWIHV